MKEFELKDNKKIIDKVDNQVLEILQFGDYWYLASAKSMWNINQFNPEDFEEYFGDKPIGEYDLDYLNGKVV